LTTKTMTMTMKMTLMAFGTIDPGFP